MWRLGRASGVLASPAPELGWPSRACMAANQHCALHAPPMAEAGATETPPRRRCVTCRGPFEPHPAAIAVQVTCSAKCRVRHRRTLAKRRRSRAPERFRGLERDRQRKHRGRVGTVVTADLSRAGLSPQVPNLLDVALRIWDEQLIVSRRRFEQELARCVGLAGRGAAGA